MEFKCRCFVPACTQAASGSYWVSLETPIPPKPLSPEGSRLSLCSKGHRKCPDDLCLELGAAVRCTPTLRHEMKSESGTHLGSEHKCRMFQEGLTVWKARTTGPMSIH